MEPFLIDCLIGNCGTLQVWQVVAIVARPLLQMDPLLEIMIDNLKRFHQWSLVTVVPS